jgi:hypothetical protein
MPDRFPGYNVLSKRWTPSWNHKTREVMNRRLALSNEPRFFTTEEYALVIAIAARIVPQPQHRPPVPIAALVDHQLDRDQADGYRHAGMPRLRDAWRQGLRALNAEAQQAHNAPFDQLRPADQDALLAHMQKGELWDSSWGDMPPAMFFKNRMATDIVHAYFAHPTAWSEIGWGGPASPRGYVRMGVNERDPWESAEVKDGDVEAARRKNRHVG